MDFLQWGLFPNLSLLVSVLVPLGILAHYWRLADFTPSTGAAFGASLNITRAAFFGRMLSAAATVVILLTIKGSWLPNRISESWASFLVPQAFVILCLGIAGVVLLGFQRTGRTAQGQIDMRPRSIWTFGRKSWFTAWIAAAVFLIATVVLAGMASSPDGDGRFTVLSVEIGTGFGTTSFPGWFYGVPVLLGVAILSVLTLVVLKLIARPPLDSRDGEDRADILLRRLLTRVVLALGCGSMTLTLSWFLLSVGEGSRATVTVPGATVGDITVGTSLAAIASPVSVAGLLLQGVGIALLMLPLVTRIPRNPLSAVPNLTTERNEPLPSQANA